MSDSVFLRKVVTSDVTFIFNLENNPENWEVSGTEKPFTLIEIENFVNQHQDIHENKQLRFMICKTIDKSLVGCIDLFEYKHGLSVGVGVIIANLCDRQHGYAKVALSQLIDFVKNNLDVEYIFCYIFKNNSASIRLFEGSGFCFKEERILFNKTLNYYELKVK